MYIEGNQAIILLFRFLLFPEILCSSCFLVIFSLKFVQSFKIDFRYVLDSLLVGYLVHRANV